VAEPQVLDLTPWLDRITAAKTQKQIYQVLEEFRPLAWSDEQRSTVAKLYMRLIANLPTGEPGTTGGATD
jgi:hypothetical protein